MPAWVSPRSKRQDGRDFFWRNNNNSILLRHKEGVCDSPCGTNNHKKTGRDKHTSSTYERTYSSSPRGDPPPPPPVPDLRRSVILTINNAARLLACCRRKYVRQKMNYWRCSLDVRVQKGRQKGSEARKSKATMFSTSNGVGDLSNSACLPYVYLKAFQQVHAWPCFKTWCFKCECLKAIWCLQLAMLKVMFNVPETMLEARYKTFKSW